MIKHFLSYFEETIKKYWDAPALSDFDGDLTISYGQTAEAIAKLHILFKEAGIEKGDKIAICGRNSAHWAVSFLAITTYEAVAVSILADFSADSVHALVNHSDSKFFMVGDVVWQGLDKDKMPNLLGIICMKDFELLYAANKKFEAKYKDRDNLFKSKYPQGFGVTDVSYPIDNLEDVALINYTSGTTSDPKGVVLSYKSISSNVQFGQDRIPNKPGWSMVSMLPLAHMFGLTFEFLYQLAGGCHVYFLSKTPSPQVLMKAFAEVHPYMILTVPLVIEKIFKKTIFPAIKKPIVRELWYIPGINTPIRRKVRDKLMQAFGGNLRHLIIGGAALNHEVENCLKQINFCYTVGYGMTECGPILGYEDWQNFKKRSCGKIVDRMTVTIDSNNPEKSVGEIMVKGDNVMMGYYKNPEATAAIFTSDGWMRTGDLGIIDKDGNIFIRGRNKSVIIGSSGQNIYPEEIEDKLNNIPGILESVVVDRGGYLTALVFPDNEALKEEQETKSMEVIMNGILVKLNKLVPPFCKIKQIELVDKEFEKTPKRSIKRFMYK
ncbi:MAG: AMP-binding protein [Paludibacteraceae bacterium]|nr:AMP-binding protein [Paludibacteraceae bacterium]